MIDPINQGKGVSRVKVICDDCGKALHIDDDRVTGALRTAGSDAGFSDVRPVVELRGLCEECASCGRSGKAIVSAAKAVIDSCDPPV